MLTTKKSRIVLATVLSFVLSFVLTGTSTSSFAATSRVLNENSANKLYAVKLGSTFHLVLHSMYWTLNAPAAGSAIKVLGDPVSSPIMPGPDAPANCRLPGMGCGTLDWSMKAVRMGTISLIATRTSCGEALKCTDANGRFSVRVRVNKG
jgi:hypothetical protein